MRRSTRLVLLLLLLLGLPVLLAAPTRAGDDPTEDAVLGLVAPRRGEVIADLGCGKGTWTFTLARAVGPRGRVLAVDIDPEAVAAVRRLAQERGVENVVAIHSVPDDPELPPDSLDAIFMNNVIDWVERRALAGFLAGVRTALKSDGRLVIRDPSGGPDRVIAELYRAGFALVEAKIPLEDVPGRSFSTGWYALKLRRSEVQPAIFPRLGLPARYRTRLHLAEELFRQGLLTREELRAKWEAIRNQPGAFDPRKDEARDLVRAARAVDVLTDAEAEALRARIDAR
ncbi:MAG: class I SAM-dependent methyltransferase [Planctomycetota bacterium]